MSNLPFAIILGAQKCGTSTLYNSLISHSNIGQTSDPETAKAIKEVDFFCVEKKWQKGIHWYASHFVDNGVSFVDCSPNYLSCPLSYERIYRMLPNIKLIICIRNPILRAYSQYNHYKQALPQSQNWDWNPSKDFITNIQIELIRYPDCLTNFNGLLAKGVYINQIKLLLKYFKREQLYISILEQWHYNYSQELNAIQNFLNLPLETLDTKIVHDRHYTVEPLTAESYELLHHYYNLYDEELFEFLGFSIPEWKVTNPSA